jgi:two-component system response regulator HydG
MQRFTSFSLSENPADARGQVGDALPGRALPDISDLSARLRFVPHEGQIWLDDQRVVMLNLAALIALRRELIETVGPRKAREVFFRMGHAAGAREALIALKVRADQPQIDAFLVGPQLHALRGEVHVEPTSIEADIESGRYFSELIWRNSAEAESHVACFGGSSAPVCWMQIGYASGYTSTVMQRPITFREVACVACGDAACRIVGRPTEEWPSETEVIYMPRTELSPTPTGGPIEGPATTSGGVVGASPGFLGAWYLLKRVAPLTTTVLLQGETGVGKEVFARALHDASPRAKSQLFSVNCAAIPESLLDSELFGVERGAYTGANQSRSGWFEAASGSTLFLDEIGTLSGVAQAKLLRVIQEGRFNRVGGTVTRTVDVRLVCATNLDLEAEVKRGNFRLDLLHRLNVFPIIIPPLRNRLDDIPPLIQYFLERFNKRTGRNISGFTLSAVDSLLLYEFPGNVRELENMIERAAILTLDDEPIDALHLFRGATPLRKTFLTPMMNGTLAECQLGNTLFGARDSHAIGEISARLSLPEMEALAIKEALAASKGNISEAARKLGLTRSKLRYRLRAEE